MKVLITGASGNLGKNITKHLLANHIPVVGLDIDAPSANSSGNGFSYHQCCITDKQQIYDIFRREQPTNVVHLAATFNKVRNKKREFAIDIGGSTNVLNASKATPSVKQLVFSSSAAAYGGHKDNPLWMDETIALRPGKYRYGIIKKTIEELYFGNKHRRDLNIVALRICSVIGPSFDKKRSAVALLINSKYILEQWRKNKVQFLHEDDFNHLMFNVLTDRDIQGIFNLAPDSYAEINELLPQKKYVNLPLHVIQGLLWLFWNLRVLNLRPACFKQSIYPIVLNPKRLVSRYSYAFKYSSEDAFQDTLKRYHLEDMGMAV